MWSRKPSKLKREFFLNKFKEEGETLVAVCDKKLIGKEFKDGKKRLKVSKNFYKDEKASEKEIKTAMQKATILNLVGERSIGVGIELGLINRKNVIEVEGVKHAQMCTFQI